MSRPCASPAFHASPASPASRINTERRSCIISSGRNAATNASAHLPAATHPPPPAHPAPAHSRPPSGHDMLAAARVLANLSATTHRTKFLDVLNEEYYDERTWYSQEAIDSMCLAAHCKALVLLSAPHSPQPCSPQPCSPQPIGYTSTGEPIYSATIVPH
jgi:hypothetical protein